MGDSRSEERGLAGPTLGVRALRWSSGWPVAGPKQSIGSGKVRGGVVVRRRETERFEGRRREEEVTTREGAG